MFLFLSSSLLGQDVLRVSAYYEHTPLSEAFSDLQSRYDLIFAYEPAALSGKIAHTSFHNLDVNLALEKLLSEAQLDYQLVKNRHVLIVKRSKEEKKVPLFSLDGQVWDAQEDAPLPFAYLYLVDLGKGILADEKGRFRFTDLPAGFTRLQVNYTGFSSRELVIRPDQKKKQQLIIRLSPTNRLLEEVLIEHGTDQNMQVADAPGQVIINPRKISNLSGLGEPDILKSIQLLPGVVGTNVASSGLYIRGGTPDQNLVRFDGITAYRVDHFFGLFSAFNSHAIQSVDVYRGGFGAKYGGRVSGVVDITGKSGRTDRPRFWAGANLLNAHVGAEIPLPKKKGSLLVAARRSYSDILESPFYNKLFNHIATPPTDDRQPWDLFRESGQSSEAVYDLNRKFTFHPLDGNRTRELGSVEGSDIYNLNSQLSYQASNQDLLRKEATPSFHFYDLNGKLNLQLSSKDVLTASFFKGADHLAYEYDDRPLIGLRVRTVDRLTLNNLGTSVSWSRQWKDRVYSKTQAAYSLYDSKYQYGFLGIDDTSGFSTFIEQYNRIQDLSMRHETHWQINQQNKLEVGAEFTRQYITYQLDSDTVGLSRNKPGSTYSGYLQHTLSPGENIDLVLGMRGTYFDKTRQWYVEPRLSLQANISKRVKAKVAWGIYQQFINRIRFNNGLGLGEDFWAISDGELIPVVNSTHFIIGAAYETPMFLIDVEAYHKTTNGLLTYSFGAAPLEVREGGNTDLLTDGTSVVTGIDVLLQKKIGLYTGWLSYSLSAVKQRFESIKHGRPFPALHDQRHETKWVNSFTLGKWDLSATMIFASGRPYTEAEDTKEDYLPDGSESVVLDVGDRNAERLPAYHRLDLGITYNYLIGKRAHGKVGISVYNLYNRRNVRARRYYVEGSFDEKEDGNISTTEILDLGLSPNLFFEIRF